VFDVPTAEEKNLKVTEVNMGRDQELEKRSGRVE
jgi:hypothetical protein